MYLILKAELYDKDLNLIKEEDIGGYNDECVDSSFYGALGKASKYCRNKILKQYLPNLYKEYITDVEDGWVWFDRNDYVIAVRIDFCERREIENRDLNR